MGSVYRAAASDGRLVALKMLRPEHDEGSQASLRFLAETSRLTRVRHPHVVAVENLRVSEAGARYCVMELLEGAPLSALLKSGPLELARGVELCAQLAEALGAVHAAGLCHRDLKPANVFITREDVVKLLDFGVAGEDGGEEGEQPALVGTPEYMAPEQLRGENALTRAVDAYAFGLVVFEVLTGRRPFEAESLGELIVQRMSARAPSLFQALPDAPVGVRDVVSDCLQRSAPLRPSDFVAVAKRLRAAQLAAWSA
jgi:eukaryotic-like serine/threonine-protein kinase